MRKEHPRQHSVAPSFSTTKSTVFVVDDDEPLLSLLRKIVACNQLPVETYGSAKDFFLNCSPDRPGCLVLDVYMPEMNGLEMLKSLAANGIDLPVIMISGAADVPLAVHAVKSGAFDFLEKPFRQHDLLTMIYAALERDAQCRRNKQDNTLLMERYQSLTGRERQVLQLLVSGKSGKEIAADLAISYKTMEKFRSKMMLKMSSESLAELVLMAIKLDLIGVTDLPGKAGG